MNALEDAGLSDYSTMRLGGQASFVAEVSTRDEVQRAVQWAKAYGLPVIMIGTGSNIVWRDEGFQGLLIVNNIRKYDSYKEDETNYYVTLGAGEPWDDAVARTVMDGLTGIECLSLIPGKAGATPIQNVGAYGQEISGTLTTVEAYDSQTDSFVMLPAADCAFGYRTSRFKTSDKGRFFITAITLHLVKGNPMPPFYAALSSYLETNNITNFTPQTIRDAVMAIRSSKLPDPKLTKNVGSFFANPIVDEAKMLDLADQYSSLPHWPAGTGLAKLSAAWLIEQTGFKGLHDKETGMSCWPSQPLVLVNDAAKSTADLLAFKQKIVDAVESKFGITLVQEPELLP